jgi:hypothetical protein
LAGAPRPGLRLIQTCSIEGNRRSGNNPSPERFLRSGPKKPFFTSTDSQRLLQVDGCALSGETVSFEYGVSRS